MMPTAIDVPAGTAVLQGSCSCGINFAVVEQLEALELHEFRPRFCPFCAGRLLYKRVDQ